MSFAPVEQFERLYKVHETLGHGQYAVVKRCVHRTSDREFAVKFVKKRRVGTSRRGAKRSDIEREIEILRQLGSHENIVHLQEVYESASDVILILEHISGGELFHHVCSKEKLCEEEASAFIKQILIGVSHLHNNFVAHLDLKPENIMLQCKSSTRIKIIDFGLSRKILPGDCVQEMIGTPEFVAPEVVEYENLSSATDMWAIGVVTYILLSGMSPFMGESRDATFANITSVNYDFDDDIFAGTSNLAKDFISRLFVRDPK